jgi:glycogen debranching enzyme
LGDYFLAMLKVRKKTPETCQEISTAVDYLREHFYEKDCIHGISEIFDGLEPGAGRGTVQQAWSVGALLKVLLSISSSK